MIIIIAYYTVHFVVAILMIQIMQMRLNGMRMNKLKEILEIVEKLLGKAYWYYNENTKRKGKG